MSKRMYFAGFSSAVVRGMVFQFWEDLHRDFFFLAFD